MALFGGVEIDLTEATFESTEIEISGFWCFGGMEIKAPAGIEVRDRTAGIFGGTEIKGLGDPLPGCPGDHDQGCVAVRWGLGHRTGADQEAPPKHELH